MTEDVTNEELFRYKNEEILPIMREIHSIIADCTDTLDRNERRYSCSSIESRPLGRNQRPDYYGRDRGVDDRSIDGAVIVDPPGAAYRRGRRL